MQTLPIKGLDLCGCVSRTFVDALTCLVFNHNLTGEGLPIAPRVIFPHLERLGLFSVLVSSQLLTAFVSSFPNLVQLDLTNTRVTPALLLTLGQNKSLRLKSLSLSKCHLLNSDSLRDLLINSQPNVLADLTELNLFYDATGAMPITKAHLQAVLEGSRVFLSGKLRYLDISTAPLDDTLLSSSFPIQPSLLDFGISNCPHISWPGLKNFIEHKGSNIEILDISGSCRQPLIMNLTTVRMARRNDALVNTIMGIHQYLVPGVGQEAPHHLRVIELEEKSLEALDHAHAHRDWRVFYGKSYRGWYVDCASKIQTHDITSKERSLSRLEQSDPFRLRMLELAKKSKSGGYNFGWHARKMAILSSDGMRESAFWRS